MKKNEKITQEELNKQLYYYPLSGIFTWLVSKGGVNIGDIAGSKQPNGYIYITLDDYKYLAHRLAWLYINGYFPENDIDHINRIKDDNRIINLREVSRQCNSRNCNIRSDNKSGVVGVFWDKNKNKWLANIKAHSKRSNLGSFDDITDAAKARWEAEVKYGFPNCNTTSTAYNYLKEKGVI